MKIVWTGGGGNRLSVGGEESVLPWRPHGYQLSATLAPHCAFLTEGTSLPLQRGGLCEAHRISTPPSLGLPGAALGSESSDPPTLRRPRRGHRRGPGAALTRDVGRWCGARFGPQPLQKFNLGGSMIFSIPSKGSAVALRGTHARARDVKRFTFLVL